jgi:hypothetical protein
VPSELGRDAVKLVLEADVSVNQQAQRRTVGRLADLDDGVRGEAQRLGSADLHHALPRVGRQVGLPVAADVDRKRAGDRQFQRLGGGEGVDRYPVPRLAGELREQFAGAWVGVNLVWRHGCAGSTTKARIGIPRRTASSISSSVMLLRDGGRTVPYRWATSKITRSEDRSRRRDSSAGGVSLAAQYSMPSVRLPVVMIALVTAAR